MSRVLAFVAFAFSVSLLFAAEGEDFRKYVRESKDFKPVEQKREVLQSGRWDHWILMPWRYQWGRNYDDACAKEMKDAGHNGAFCDHNPGGAEIHEKYGFLWYMDHTAGKGDLYLRDPKKEARAAGNRPVCLIDPATLDRMKKKISGDVAKAKQYKTRAAYALDDEISWTTFTSPAKWDNNVLSRNDFGRWLKERYGSEDALKKQWTENAPPDLAGTVGWGSWAKDAEPPAEYVKRMANPDDLQGEYGKPMDQWNLSAWCDAMSYMDSQFMNVVGDLVAYTNTIDPETPCGFVGGQAPAPFGGFDYAKVMRKIQFLEAYDIGASMEMARSFNPDNLIPTVKTGFGDPAQSSGVWFNWYYMVHGDRGVIAWAENWFKDQGKNVVPAQRVMDLGKAVQRIAQYSKALYGAKWAHDGVALYYSHPSVQVSWFIDCQNHKRTWINRSSSMNNTFASTIGTDWAWQKLLEDAKIQYNWVSYVDLLQKGLNPKEYKVLILPRVLCLSKDEADEIKKYVEAGGVVIADHQTGIFDQHGKGYAGGKGALDDLFGIKSRPVCKSGSLFAGAALTEIDAETYYGKKNFIFAGAEIWPKCQRDKGLVLAQRDMPGFQEAKAGQGWACHLNTSLIEYTHVRLQDYAKCAAFAKPVIDLLAKANVKPWVQVAVAGQEPPIVEATYWEKDGRVLVCVVKNPMKFASETGETKTEGVSKETVQLTINFDTPKTALKDEIEGKDLGNAKSVTVPWKMDEAAIVSFKK